MRAIDGTIGITLRNLSGDTSRSQPLHLDASVPADTDFLFSLAETQLGGCYYLGDVEAEGGGIHVVPGGPRLVEEKVRIGPDGRGLYDGWKRIDDFPDSVEVIGAAGDFALLHHLMPHAASHNRRAAPRVAQFTRFVRDDHPHGAAGPVPPDRYGAREIHAMSALGRKLLGVEAW